MEDFDNEIERQRIELDPQEVKVCFNCDRCNAEIYEGNKYYFYERNSLCEECFDDIQSEEKFNSIRIAGDEDDY